MLLDGRLYHSMLCHAIVQTRSNLSTSSYVAQYRDQRSKMQVVCDLTQIQMRTSMKNKLEMTVSFTRVYYFIYYMIMIFLLFHQEPAGVDLALALNGQQFKGRSIRVNRAVKKEKKKAKPQESGQKSVSFI